MSAHRPLHAPPLHLTDAGMLGQVGGWLSPLNTPDFLHSPGPLHPPVSLPEPTHVPRPAGLGAADIERTGCPKATGSSWRPVSGRATRVSDGAGREGPRSHYAEPHWAGAPRGLPLWGLGIRPERRWPGQGRTGGAAQSPGPPPHRLHPPGEGSEQQLLERQKLLFPCWVNICGNPRKRLAAEQGPRRLPGAPGPPQPRHPGPQPPGPSVRSGWGRPSGQGTAPAPSPALFPVLSTAHKVPECFTPGRAIAAFSGVKCNLPEIKPNYGIS